MGGRRSKSAKTERQAGFSLVEILVAFAILSLAIAALLPVFSNSLNAAHVANARALARPRLESLLAEVGTTRKLRPGDESGAYEDGYA